jgi:hypothetical protein
MRRLIESPEEANEHHKKLTEQMTSAAMDMMSAIQSERIRPKNHYG